MNTLSIRRRIKSVGNVKQITKAMELTAAAKMHKATSAVLGARPYASRALTLVRSLESRGAGLHPLLEIRPVKKELLIVVSTDKGLVGGLNNQLVKAVVQHIKQRQFQTDVIVIGKKGMSILAKFNLSIVANYTDVPANPDPSFSRPISLFARTEFLKKSYDAVKVYYNFFESTLVQKPTLVQILPFNRHPELLDEKDNQSEIFKITEALFEPDKNTVLETILPRLIDQLLFQIMLESTASQHASQMVAMRSATDNAGDLMDDLQLTYNSIRQTSITAEMAEISASIGALE